MFDDLVDSQKGKLAFVLGSGPSLRHVDMELLKPHVTIAVNSAIVKALFAQYFMTCEHGLTLFKSWLMLRNLKCQIYMHTLAQMNFFQPQTGLDAFEGIDENRRNYFRFKPLEQGMKMGKDTDQMIRGSSSVHTAVHLAHILGCSHIVLLGCDCLIEDEKYHFYDFPGEPEEGYIKPEYEKLKPMYTFPVERKGNTDRILLGHVACWIKLAIANQNIDIINASPGLIDAFPRMTVEEAIEEYRRRK